MLDDAPETQSSSSVPVHQLELPNANIPIDDELASIWATAEIIGALSSDDYRWSFTSVLLALLYSEQDISRWFLGYAQSAKIRLSEIGGRRGFDPAQLPKMRTEFARGGTFLKKSAFTTSTISLFQGAAELYGRSVSLGLSSMSGRHLMGAFIYRLPSGHIDQLHEWGFVPSDWSTNFLTYVSSRVPQESFWTTLHAEHFPTSPPPPPNPPQPQDSYTVVPLDINTFQLSDAVEQILIAASVHAAAYNRPLSTGKILLEMADQGRTGSDPLWAGALLHHVLLGRPDATDGDPYEQMIRQYRSERDSMMSSDPVGTPQLTLATIMTAGLAWSLKRAGEIAVTTSGDPRIRGRHLLAALIVEPPQPYTLGSQRRLQELGIDVSLFRERLYNWVRGYGDNEESWRIELFGTVAESLRKAQFDADDTTGPDFLQIEQDVLALATLIAARDSSPPLSIGLFGDWGSGKTFFMGHLTRKISELAKEAADSGKMQRELPFYKHIVQIEFNAWHYVEGNLWASMVEHILDNLSATRQQTATEMLQKHWIEKLGFAETASAEANRKASEAAAKVSKAEGEAEAAKTELEKKKTELQELSGISVARDFKLSGALPVISQLLVPLGLKPASDAVVDLELSLREAWSVLERGNATLMPLVHAKDRKDRWRSLLIILFGAPLAAALVGWQMTRLDKPAILAQIWAVATGAAGLLGGCAAWLRKQAKWVSDQTERVRQAQSAYDNALKDELKDAAERQARVEQELATARQEYALAQQRADRARREEDVARSDLAAATTSRLLGQFIQDRAASTDYRKHLGVLAIVRQDFQKLSQLIEEDNWRLAPEGRPDDAFFKERKLKKVTTLAEEEIDASTRINRIVLYIDDLDRCPPAKVVDVLQAVHLLLAFPLFVVVVGVDARWISRSLEARYRELLHVGNAEAAVDLARMFGVARSEDYLEKIFQIPLWLRTMDSSAARRMVQGLLRPIARTEGSRNGVAQTANEAEKKVPDPNSVQFRDGVNLPANSPTPAEPHDATPTTDKLTERSVNSPPEKPEPKPPAVPNLDSLQVGDFELAAIDALAPLLGRSPRALKRFVNIYRLIKARLTPAEHNAFIRRSDSALAEYEAVLFLLALDTGLPRISRVVFDDLFSISTAQQFIKNLDQHSSAGTPDWRALRTWVVEQSKENERFNNGITRIAAWVDQVSRYSFQATHLEANFERLRVSPPSSIPATASPPVGAQSLIPSTTHPANKHSSEGPR